MKGKHSQEERGEEIYQKLLFSRYFLKLVLTSQWQKWKLCTLSRRYTRDNTGRLINKKITNNKENKNKEKQAITIKVLLFRDSILATLQVCMSLGKCPEPTNKMTHNLRTFFV